METPCFTERKIHPTELPIKGPDDKFVLVLTVKTEK